MLSTDDKKFIIKSVENGYKVSDLAKMFNVTPRRVQQILKEDVSGENSRRKFSTLTQEEAKEIENLWVNYKIGSRTIYYLMKSKGRNVSYYQIYNFMRNHNMIRTKRSSKDNGKGHAHEEPLTTIYMDYHQTAMDNPYAIVCVDMATKKILSIVESRKITKEVMQSLVDSMTSFTSENNLTAKNLHLRSGVLSILYGATDLRYQMKKSGVEHVEADKHGNRVHLALSRLWQNYDKFRWTFEGPDNFMYWYNNRPIINRVNNKVTTPNEIMDRYLDQQQSYPIPTENTT